MKMKGEWNKVKTESLINRVLGASFLRSRWRWDVEDRLECPDNFTGPEDRINLNDKEQE